MISKLCQSLDWEYLVYWAIPCIDSCLRAKGKLWHSLFYPLFESGWKLFCVCLCTESWDQREGWSGCWGLIKQFWILTGSSRTIDIPHPNWWPTTQDQPLCEEGSASSPFEYILPHLVGQSFSIWPWQGHIPNGSHSIGVVQKWWRVKN